VINNTLFSKKQNNILHQYQIYLDMQSLSTDQLCKHSEKL